jgi:hypothetical protein
MQNLFHSDSGNSPNRFKANWQIQLPPPPEFGVNLWIMSCARRCQLRGIKPDDAMALIYRNEKLLRPGRLFMPGEVERAVRRAYDETIPSAPTRPPKALKQPPLAHFRVMGDLIKIEDLIRQSPELPPMDVVGVLRRLFAPSEFLAFKQANKAKARGWQVINLDGTPAASGDMQFITSNPVTGAVGLTQDGRPSLVAKNCFPQTKHVVVEFDAGDSATQATKVRFLADFAPLALALYSGNKSLHAWFRFDGNETRAEEFRQLAAALGADPASLRRHQTVRCPNARRDNGVLQEVLFFNPELKPL